MPHSMMKRLTNRFTETESDIGPPLGISPADTKSHQPCNETKSDIPIAAPSAHHHPYVPHALKPTSTRSPAAIGNCRVNDPLMMISPASIPRPNSASFRASQTTEFSGLPSTASPRPVATVCAVDPHRRGDRVQRQIA